MLGINEIYNKKITFTRSKNLNSVADYFFELYPLFMHLELLNSGRLSIKGHSDHGPLRKQFETFVIPKNEKFKTRFKSEISD